MTPKNKLTGQLVVTRHGESEWNALGKWTGTTDVHLTPKGEEEARGLGMLLSDIKFDQVFVSGQVRTHETADQMLIAANQPVKYQIAPAINERDYGIFTGKNKWQVKEQIGSAAFERIRRGWSEPVEAGEMLRDVYVRAVPFYHDTVVPLLAQGRNVLLVAHGNSIRSLVKYIESVSDEDIAKVEMIFGTALIYTVDKQGKMVDKQVRDIHTTPPPA